MDRMGEVLRLSDVRSIFRLIGEIRSIGADPAEWRTHMVRRLRRFFDAEIVISSEVHVRPIPGQINDDPEKRRVVDVGWGCDGSDGTNVWRIFNESDARPQEYMVSMMSSEPDPEDPSQTLAVKPMMQMRSGRSFVLSQCSLPHWGTVDQLGLHKEDSQKPFTSAQHRLIRLFHQELGRLWRKDALMKARDPGSELPRRLSQTLTALRDGCSEKEVSLRLHISQHTVHNYVKALHQRLGVSSRGELLAKMRRPDGFLPQFSVKH